MKNKSSLLLFTFLFLLQSCYSYRIVVNDSTPVADSKSKTVHSLFWGLMNDPQQVVARECVSNSIHEVKISTNTGYVILSILTLGIWMPLDVEWKCGPQKVCDEEPL